MNTQSTPANLITKSTILFLGLLTAMGPFLMDLYLPALPLLPSIFNVSPSMIQMTLTTTMVGLALGQIIIGPLSDTYGRRLPLIVGMFVSTLASLLFTQATSIEMLLFSRFLQGFAGSSGLVIARAIARDLASGPELGALMATLMMVNGFAPVIAPLLGGQILYFFDWHAVFFVLAFICAILGLKAISFPETLHPENRTTGGLQTTLQSFKVLLKDSYFVGHCMIQWFAFGGFFAYIAGSSFVFQNIYGLNSQEYSYLFGFMSLGIIGASSIGKRLSTRMPVALLLKYSLMIATLGSLAFLINISLGAPMWVIVACLYPTIATISVMGATTFSLAMTKYGHTAGSGSALLGFFSLASAGLMAPLVGLGGEANGIPMGLIMTFGNSAALFFFYLLVNNKE